MRVLVTGANGFVGRNVIEHLMAHTNWKIAAVDITPSSSIHLRVDSHVFDLRTPISPNEFGNVDAVIHLAASSDVLSFLADARKHVMNNVANTLSLLQWSLTQDLKMFIQVSTNEVYGSSIIDVAASKEWDPLIPATPYSASKAAQEMMAIAWHQTYGTPSVIVNTSHLFGEGQPRQRFIPTVAKNVFYDESVPIYGRQFTSGGEWDASIRNWTYVGDFAHALHYIIERGFDSGYVDRWNVAGPIRNCYEVAEQVAELLELPLSVEWFDNREARPGYEHRYALDTTAFANYGYTELYGFDEGLRRTVDWFKETLQK